MSEEEDRIAAMEQFIAQFPDNPFPRYALAMEHKSAGRLEDAARTLAAIAEKLSDYVPTYLQLGMVLEELGRTDEARDAFTRGIEAAQNKGDAHALSELQGALSNL